MEPHTRNRIKLQDKKRYANGSARALSAQKSNGRVSQAHARVGRKPHMSQRTIPPRNFPSGRTETTQTRLTHQWDQSTPKPSTLDGLPEDVQTVLYSVTGDSSVSVCHLMNDDGQPLCGCRGSFSQLAVEEARSQIDRLCENCRIQYDGAQRTRPCPNCHTPVRMSAWPQHVRGCDGDE
ncbi:hypothetical protein SAMN05444342_4256 [Haladaptatus paucihalophilus DX253]|uniref:Uncharacterized protein n=1 Tax=Haladaptatus paucihalophilus DX253 TaxID=797209 RepID=A0A1M7C244_HALPU|nr:hypothetical protein SAMN05444342_4256 [Haladaptatus paucihalophilus DX253]